MGVRAVEERMANGRIITRKLVKPRLTVTYPQVAGLENGLVQTMVNSSMIDAVYELIRKQGYVTNPQLEITGSFETKLHDKGLLSVVYDNYGYSQGAAHGITYRSSQTFHLTDGTLYRLEDLFKPGSDYVRRISDIIRREWKERDIPMIAEFQSIRPDQDFYMTEKALGIYFQLYEYTPYAYGFPTFEIPYIELMNMLSTEGPVGILKSEE